MQIIDKKLKGLGVFLAGIAVVGISGCATMNKKSGQDHGSTIQALNKSVTRVQSELNYLRASQQGDPDKNPHIYNSPKTGPIAQKITLNWSGPIEPVIKSVAKMVGYEFKVIGRSPSTPILVDVHEEKQPAFSILQDIGWQAGKSVGVTVKQNPDDPGEKIIAVTYRGQAKGR